MTHIIGIAGTHSTGKTTFVDQLTNELTSLGKSVERVGDKARACRDAGFPILKEHTFESTLWIMTTVIRAELEAERKADIVLVDRPVPDALGYLEAALESTNRVIKPDERLYLYNLAKMHCCRYDLLFKTELLDSIPLGPGRDTDLVFRKLAGIKIDDSLRQLEIHSETLTVSNHSQAIEQILNCIQK